MTAAVGTAPNPNELVADHQGMVRAIAFKVMRKLPRNMEVDDLIAYGNLGLLEAASRYNPDAGAQFSSFAYYRVQGAIYDGLRKIGWLNRTEYAHVRAERGSSAYLQHQSDRSAGVIGEDKRSLDESLGDTADVIASLVTVFVTSLEGIDGYEPEDEKAGGIHDQVEKKQMLSIVRETIESLPEQDQVILKGFYFQDKSLKEIGEEMGISKSWMSRKHAQCIDRLRKALEIRLKDATLILPRR
jgi:RNA polymerase sigma factor FliA